jgi:dTDP-4-amino-4,6-dideoxygalactose transaminase
MNVPFVDLAGQHQRIRDDLDSALRGVIDKCAFIGGPALHEFECELAEFMHCRYAKGVSSCTAALAMALRSLGLAPEDEVITTVHTAIPTAEAVLLAGARLVFADVEEATFQIDPDHVESLITARTRAIVPVHLYGLAARIDRIVEIAERHRLTVIEDVAQAQGARFEGKRLGTFGRAAGLSFFPSKNLGGFGDGGAVVTDDEKIHRFVTMYSNHGRLEKFAHEIPGANERLDGLQAAVLRVKLAHLDEWNARRREVAAWYEEELGDVEGIVLPRPIEGSEPVWHLYVVRVADREALQGCLKEHGIGTGVHYPLALHQQPVFASYGHAEGSFPAAERICREIVSLPMGPSLIRGQIAFVGEKIRGYLGG